jgi:hypothetical protein
LPLIIRDKAGLEAVIYKFFADKGLEAKEDTIGGIQMRINVKQYVTGLIFKENHEKWDVPMWISFYNDNQGVRIHLFDGERMNLAKELAQTILSFNSDITVKIETAYGGIISDDDDPIVPFS